jgi:GT2 family glycosyltransferase
MTHDPPLVSICVVSLDGHDRLRTLLRSLYEHTSHIDYEVVIVESGSRVRDYTLRMNRALMAGAGKYLVGLNDDVEVTAGWLDPLLAAVSAWSPVVFPDQSSTDGLQCIVGWCVVFDAEWARAHGPYDSRFSLWCSDIDLAKRLVNARIPARRVAIPTPLIHELSATMGRQDIRDEFQADCVADLDAYEKKWGTRAETDKFALV